MAGAGGMSKMLVLLPVMFAARKIDGEDPNVVFLLRCTYFTVQAVVVLVVAYIYIKATSLATSKEYDRIVYVPPPPQPFADPNAKKKYTEVRFGAHMAAQARSLLGSTLFGLCLTTALHLWKGMVVGLAIQTIMGPFNLFENKLAMAFLFGKGLSNTSSDSENRIFDEKVATELTDEDEVVDEKGDVVVVSGAGGRGAIKDEKTQTFEDLLLDTWDLGAEADLAPLLAALNKSTINYTTQENGWTPLMVVSGLGTPDTVDAMRRMKALGSDPTMLDVEGWNALHWAAFHGSAEAAKVLLDDFDGLKNGLLTVKDKEGKTPLQHARAEGNEVVAKVIEEAEKSLPGSSESDGTEDEGLRKRK